MKNLQILFTIFLSTIFLNANAQSSDINFDGTASFVITSKEIKIEVQKIKNFQDDTETGTLKLTLYLSKDRYAGGRITGYKVAEKKLGELRSGKKFKNIKFNSPWLVVPPMGEYYVTLILSEYGDDEEYWIVDDIRFTNKQTVDFY